MKPRFHAWSAAQRKAITRLKLIGETFFRSNWNDQLLRPRFDPLVIGPSGSGKSHLVKTVASELDVPVLRLTHGEWIVRGARTTSPHTLTVVRKFIESVDRGIIHIDELDKARAGFRTEWTIAVFAEIFDLLDRRLPTVSRDSKGIDPAEAYLRRNIWFVGSGTWQDLWNRGPSVGFHADARATSSVEDEMKKSPLIPPELLRRFCGTPIVLTPPTVGDFQRSAKAMGLSKLSAKLRHPIDFESAVRSGLGARWLEEVYADLLTKAWETGRRDLLPERTSAPDDAPADGTDEELPF